MNTHKKMKFTQAGPLPSHLIAFFGFLGWIGSFSSLPALGAETGKAEAFLISNTPIKLIEREHLPRKEECVDCHIHKDKAVFPRKGRPVKEHGEISNIHGKRQVSCHNCHDPNQSNLLRSTDDFKSDFSNPSPVCATCHAIIFEEWRKGLHGKRMSGKDGVREQLHCVSCHESHSVKFKKMRAIPPPAKHKFLIEKHEEEELSESAGK